jgi:amidohydrolase
MNPELKEHIKQRAQELAAHIREIREYLHRNPELSYQEFETMKFVSERLSEIGIPHQTEIGGTGVVGLIKASHHTDDMLAIGLRADLDALPILEENDVPYRSVNEGVMHACGHDVHTAVLLGAAQLLWELRERLPFPVKLIFQPGEEKNPGGASLMIRDGVLKDPIVKEIYALHVFNDLPCGQAGFKEGIYMASCDEIHLTIVGRGGHGATPHQCIDPIMIGANLLIQLQQIVSRKCDPKIPCVLSFGHFEALGATNVIPSKAHIKGTFRTMNEPWRAEALELIEKMIRSIVEAHGAQVELEISKGYPYLENDPGVTSKIRSKAISLLGPDNVVDLPIRLTAEDFSYYSQEIPVCFFRLGTGNKDLGLTYGVHHPRFDIDPASLPIGVALMTLAAFSE